MIKRLVVELANSLCSCPDGTRLALDIIQGGKGGGFELQLTCTECETYLVRPLASLSALITVDVKHTEPDSKFKLPMSKGKPKLVLIQGGASKQSHADAEHADAEHAKINKDIS